jgi:AcrR family transcriptional regulator
VNDPVAVSADDDDLEAILEAALWCFSRYGESATTIETIAERAGLPATVVSRHFPDIPAVRRGLFDLWAERLSAWAASV